MNFSDERKRDRKERLLLFLGGLILSVVASVLVARVIDSPIRAILACAGVLLTYCYLSRRWMIVEDTRVPIVVYHSVSENPAWMIDTHISLPVETFEKQIRNLAHNGYRTASLEEIQLHIEGKRVLPPKTIALTFDDGYLDNWVAVYPILKQYHFSGTIFVPIDFVDPRQTARSTLEDVWREKVRREDLEWDGYVSWKELEIMEREEVLAVESHTKTHTWLFCDSKVVDFYRPGDRRHWMQWNECPDGKSRWFVHKAEEDMELMGQPVHLSKRSHRVKRRYIHNPTLTRHLNTFVRDNGGEAFFERADWEALIRGEMERSSIEPGRWEAEEETRKRIDGEFKESKSAIESRLGKEVRFLCWPGEEREPWLEELAPRFGYRGTTVLNGYNRVGDDPGRLARFYVPTCCRHGKHEKINYWSFCIALRLYEGNYFYYLPFLLLDALIKTLNRKSLRSRQA